MSNINIVEEEIGRTYSIPDIFGILGAQLLPVPGALQLLPKESSESMDAFSSFFHTAETSTCCESLAYSPLVDPRIARSAWLRCVRGRGTSARSGIAVRETSGHLGAASGLDGASCQFVTQNGELIHFECIF